MQVRSSAYAVSKMRAVNLGHKHLHAQHPRANTRGPRCQVSRIFWVHHKIAPVYCPCTSNPSRKPASSSLRSPQVHAVHTKHCLNDVHCRCCPTAHTSKSTLRAHSPIKGPSSLSTIHLCAATFLTTFHYVLLTGDAVAAFEDVWLCPCDDVLFAPRSHTFRHVFGAYPSKNDTSLCISTCEYVP